MIGGKKGNMDHTTKHPAMDHFDGIRGKTPAHADHAKEHHSHKHDKYHEGGHDGFNHQDGVLGESGNPGTEHGNTEDAATSYGGAITVPKP